MRSSFRQAGNSRRVYHLPLFSCRLELHHTSAAYESKLSKRLRQNKKPRLQRGHLTFLRKQICTTLDFVSTGFNFCIYCCLVLYFISSESSSGTGHGFGFFVVPFLPVASSSEDKLESFFNFLDFIINMRLIVSSHPLTIDSPNN